MSYDPQDDRKRKMRRPDPPEQGDLFDPRNHYRRTDPETSREAAESLDLPALEKVVLDAIKKHGPSTTTEIAEATGLDLVSVSPRPARLCAKGLVRDSGEKRVPPGKTRRSIVWELA
jgi:DNA-binding MarR family transcriptional regulator